MKKLQSKIWIGILFIAFTACQKEEINPIEKQENLKTKQFLSLPNNSESNFVLMTEELAKQNSEGNFIPRLVNTFGYAKWDYAEKIESGNGVNYLIPIANDKSKEVTAIIQCIISGQNTNFYLLTKSNINLVSSIENSPDKFDYQALFRIFESRLYNAPNQWQTIVNSENEILYSYPTDTIKSKRFILGESCITTTIIVGEGSGQSVSTRYNCSSNMYYIETAPTLPQLMDDDYGGSGGMGGETLKPTYSFAAPDPGYTIKDVKIYTKPFDSSKPAKVTIYVFQPKPGTRETWVTEGARIINGHTFVSIEQTVNGTKIVRNIGFYPKAETSNPSYKGPSALGADMGERYNISLEISVSADKFKNVLDIINNPKPTYSLQKDGYNCSDFGIDVAKGAGVNLPYTSSEWGSWLTGYGEGRNPGDLGEDIRSMKSTQNTLINTEGGRSPINTGLTYTYELE